MRVAVVCAPSRSTAVAELCVCVCVCVCVWSSCILRGAMGQSVAAGRNAANPGTIAVFSMLALHLCLGLLSIFACSIAHLGSA